MNTFIAAFIDELDKFAADDEKEDKRDRTEKSIHRGAGIGAAALGALGAAKGGLRGAVTEIPKPKFSRIFPPESRKSMSPAQVKQLRKTIGAAHKVVRAGRVVGGAASGAVRGGAKGLLIGGTLGYLLRGRHKTEKEETSKK